MLKFILEKFRGPKIPQNKRKNLKSTKDRKTKHFCHLYYRQITEGIGNLAPFLKW